MPGARPLASVRGLNKNWKLTQILNQGFVKVRRNKHFGFDEASGYYWNGVCRLQINERRKVDGKHSFSFFVPRNLIRNIYVKRGLRATLRKIWRECFSNRLKSSGPVRLTNFHFKATFNFSFSVLASRIIPAIFREFDNIKLKLYNGEGAPQEVSHLSPDLENQVKTCMQLFVKIGDVNFPKKSGKLKLYTLKFMRGKGAKTSKVTCVTPLFTRRLFEILNLVQSFDD